MIPTITKENQALCSIPEPRNAAGEHTQGTALVSVVIPAYQCSEVIARAIDSVVAQTYRDFEIILVNDGSPDTNELEAAVAPYAAQVRYLKQENRGPGGARNAGVLASRGKYVAFLDSDDAWLPHHLARQVGMLQADPSLDLVYADSVLMEGENVIGHAFGREPQSPPVTFEAILTEDCTIATSSAVASRQSLIDSGLFDPQFRRCEDFDLWLRMSFRGCRMNYRPQPGLCHYLVPGSLASNAYLLKRARIDVYQKTLLTLPLSASQRELVGRLIAETEVNCHKDMVKKFLGQGEYATALDEARRANATRTDWKLKLAVLGLRTIPQVVRYCQIGYERVLMRLSRARRANSIRKLQRSSALIPSS